MRVNRIGNTTTRSRVFALLALLGVTALLASCSSSSDYSSKVEGSGAYLDLITPAIAVSNQAGKQLTNGAVGQQPGQPIVVKATDGVLSDVSIPRASGDGTIKGTLSADGTTWTSTDVLGFGTQYTVKATAVGVGGQTVNQTQFTTSVANNLTAAYLMPEKGSTVGIAQPVAVRFDEPVQDRKAAQEAITVTTTPKVEGAFHWISDSEVRWRPKDFWKTGTKVDVKVNIEGKDLGGGTFGQQNSSTSFTIGRDLELVADDNTKQVVVKKNGKVIRTMNTSMGKADAPTNNGIYIIGDRLDHIIMDSSTYGVPVNSADGYRTPVDYATQMSYSGIYLHSAPWSVWAQGNTNTSHGCLNLSPEDALWVMQNTLRGDPVTVKNTVGDPLPYNDGLGDWNMSWAEWKKGNA